MELMTRVCNTERMNIERLFARGFVILGGIFWLALLLASQFGYAYTPLGMGTLVGVWALAIIVVTFVVGLYYEYIAAILLFAGAFLVAAYGAFMKWSDPGVWIIMAVFFMAPMIVAAILYLLAARMQSVCELEESKLA